jgi:hypothetical protein
VGGWPKLLGQVELDACIMDGKGLRSGAVDALQGCLYPISAARFAAECGAESGPLLTAYWLWTEGMPIAERRLWMVKPW